MPNEAEVLKGEIAEKREELGRKVSELESRVTDTVENVVDVVQTTAHNLNPIEQIRRHPLPALGVATAAGFLLATWARGGRSNPAFSSIKRIGATLLFKTLADSVRERSPQLASSFEEIENQVIESLTHAWRPVGGT